MAKFIDCFTYFNEKELLELRIKLLQNYVDKFVIVDANYTHSGIPKEYTLKKTIDELNLPKDKIEVIEVDMSDENLQVTEYDIKEANTHGHYKNIKPSRERTQRDSIAQCLKTNDFDDDTVFLVSDCDEILRPELVELYKKTQSLNERHIHKICLESLEGRADMQLYDAKNPNQSRNWRYSMFTCTKKQMETASLSSIRADNMNPYPIVWIYEGDKPKEACGWHFTWMGNNQNRLLKSKSFCHFEDGLECLSHLNYRYNSPEAQNFILNHKIQENQIPPSGDNRYILKKYPIEKLPQIIFELPRVKQYLLPE